MAYESFSRDNPYVVSNLYNGSINYTEPNQVSSIDNYPTMYRQHERYTHSPPPDVKENGLLGLAPASAPAYPSFVNNVAHSETVESVPYEGTPEPSPGKTSSSSPNKRARGGSESQDIKPPTNTAALLPESRQMDFHGTNSPPKVETRVEEVKMTQSNLWTYDATNSLRFQQPAQLSQPLPDYEQKIVHLSQLPNEWLIVSDQRAQHAEQTSTSRQNQYSRDADEKKSISQEGMCPPAPEGRSILDDSLEAQQSSKEPEAAIPGPSNEDDKGKKKKKGDPGHIPRPMNAFMVWSKERRQSISQEYPKLHNSSISKILGNEWKSMSEEQKLPFKEKAQQISAKHKVDNPGYRYQPKRKQKKVTPSKQQALSFHSSNIPSYYERKQAFHPGAAKAATAASAVAHGIHHNWHSPSVATTLAHHQNAAVAAPKNYESHWDVPSWEANPHAFYNGISLAGTNNTPQTSASAQPQWTITPEFFRAALQARFATAGQPAPQSEADLTFAYPVYHTQPTNDDQSRI